MADVAYDGDFGIPISFTFTPTTGTAFGTTQAQAQEFTPADTKVETQKFTPISGTNAGKEQFILGKVPSATIQVKATYSSAEHAAAQTCLAAKVKGALVVTYSDGSSDTYSGALTGMKGSTINASSERTDDLEFTVSLPSTFASA
jgi:hypothetical protein